jgi:two-component system, NarL family, response regulator DesR
MIRVLLAEDQAMIRGALAALLAAEPDIEVVAQAAGGDQAVSEALLVQPDVVLLDIEMPGMNGLSAAAQLRARLPVKQEQAGVANEAQSHVEAAALPARELDAPGGRLGGQTDRGDDLIQGAGRRVAPGDALDGLGDREVLRRGTAG